LDPIGNLARIGDVQWMDVRRRYDCPGAVSDCELRQLEALRERRRTVVDARQQVKVDL
jgi:hypothetical protein